MSKYGSKHMIHTDIYKPNPAKCCAACIFDSGEHEPWCQQRQHEQVTAECQESEYATNVTVTSR